MLHEATNASPATAEPGDVAPFPEGSRILHIGPPKTGTTALQAACWRAHADLLGQGVRYAGGEQHLAIAGRAVTGYQTVVGDRKAVPSIRWWKALVREIDGAREPRVLYSSETLADADDDAIRRIAEDIGQGIQVLVTLRPIDAVLASQWQQSVQSGSVQPLEAWLRRTIGDADSARKHPRAHRVFRQGELVDRWAAVVGRERVTVIVLDRRDPGFLFRTAESLLALRPGTLRPDDDQSNRSLSLGEVEVIRHMNILGREAGIGDGARGAFVLSGAAATVKRRPVFAGGGTVRLPAWAATQAVGMGEASYARLSASGVRILGDPHTLIPTPPMAVDAGAGLDGPDGTADDEAVWVDAATAATMAMGVAWGTGLRLGPNQPVAPRELALTFVPTRVLARQIVRRGLAWLGRSRKLAGLGD